MNKKEKLMNKKEKLMNKKEKLMNKKEKSIIQNGKLTAIIIIMVLIFAMIFSFISLLLLTLLDNTTDESFKKTIRTILYASTIYTLINGISAMVKRGWTFSKELFSTLKEQKEWRLNIKKNDKSERINNE